MCVQLLMACQPWLYDAELQLGTLFPTNRKFLTVVGLARVQDDHIEKERERECVCVCLCVGKLLKKLMAGLTDVIQAVKYF